MNKLSAKELDAQCKVNINRWIDIDSEECAMLDPDIALAKKWAKLLMPDGSLFTDSEGRIWGKGNDGYYPYHFEVGTKRYGYRMSKKAAN